MPKRWPLDFGFRQGLNIPMRWYPPSSMLLVDHPIETYVDTLQVGTYVPEDGPYKYDIITVSLEVEEAARDLNRLLRVVLEHKKPIWYKWAGTR